MSYNFQYGMPNAAPTFPQTTVPQLPTDISSMSSWGSAPGTQFQTGDLTTFANNGGQGGMFSGMSDWMKSSGILGSTNGQGVTTQGWGAPALGAAQGLLSAYMGMKQYGLAKDSLAEGKRQFALNYDAQRQTTNTQLEDRQRARVASNAGAYQSVGDYMSTNGIKG